MSASSRQLSRFTAILAGGTMLSRLLGLVRDMVLGVIPGASRESFLVAFKLANMLRDMVGEGALNAAFVPVFSESRERDGDEGYRATVAAAIVGHVDPVGYSGVSGGGVRAGAASGAQRTATSHGRRGTERGANSACWLPSAGGPSPICSLSA